RRSKQAREAFARGLALCLEVVEEDPRDHWAWLAVYRAATLAGDEDARLQAATHVVCRPPLTPELAAALESTDWIEVAWLAGRAANNQLKNRRYESARDLYALATSMAARLHGRETLEYGIVAKGLASSSVELDDLETAVAAIHEAIHAFRAVSDPRITGAQIVLADAMARGGAVDEAAAELREAIAAAAGPERAELRVQAGVRLAQLLAQHDDPAALEAGEAVWRDAREALSPSDIAYLRAAATCAHRRWASGEQEQGCALQREAVALCRQIREPGDHELVIRQLDLARMERELDRPELSAELASEVIDALQALGRHDDVQLGEAYHERGLAEMKRGRGGAAAADLGAAINVFTMCFGSESPRVLEIQKLRGTFVY
ncbi:MAG: hypothetical protein KC457_06695, partial [Myxococcales bacterium]|nr:hypothetical protein [Myxococcales bacterium]